jgi:ZIP family zinc transporter
VSLAGASSVALLVAIFASTCPRRSWAPWPCARGRSRGFVVCTWAICGVLLAAAVVLGDGLGSALGDSVLAVALGFAGGAVLASIADTLMPEAYADGGPFTAFATAAGFFLSFVLAV